MSYTTNTTPYEAASSYLDHGISVIPIRTDGTKSPTTEWREFVNSPPTIEQVQSWFDNVKPPGIGIVGGRVSGNLVVIDFDYDAEQTFELFWTEAQQRCPGVVEQLAVVATPRPGRHVYFRSDGAVPRTEKLAISVPQRSGILDADGVPILAPAILIETRAEARTQSHREARLRSTLWVRNTS